MHFLLFWRKYNQKRSCFSSINTHTIFKAKSVRRNVVESRISPKITVQIRATVNLYGFATIYRLTLSMHLTFPLFSPHALATAEDAKISISSNIYCQHRSAYSQRIPAVFNAKGYFPANSRKLEHMSSNCEIKLGQPQ